MAHRMPLPCRLMPPIIFLAMVLLAGCTPRPAPPTAADTAPPMQAVAILPVAVQPPEPAAGGQAAQGLAAGRRVMAELLARYFAEDGRPQARFVDAATLEGLPEADLADPAHLARTLAPRFRADGVLQLTLTRYRDRRGTRYSVEEPAAVGFSYVLRDTAGRVRCSGSFDAEQESALANIFAFSFRRGFAWLSGPDFAGEALAKELGQCSALNPGHTGP